MHEMKEDDFMPRPRKYRQVRYIPNVTGFTPSGNININDVVKLNVDELEAIRLSDLENLGQEECAESMKISRGTFQRILNSARKKIADSFINGKKIDVEGGDYYIAECLGTCGRYSPGYNANGRYLANCPRYIGTKKFCTEVCNRYKGGKI